jgi:RimJ/RimL family protein N-acetyltransferase
VTTAGEAPRAAWARLVGLDTLARLAVIVDPRSPICRTGWIGILALDDTVTVAVPTEALRDPVRSALAGVTPTDAARPDVVGPLLSPTRSVLGPATLSYPPLGFVPDRSSASPVPTDELRAFLATMPSDDLEESGFVADDMEAVHGSRTEHGAIASVCGYRRWPNGVAHLGILTSPDHRRRGHARQAATAALRAAIDDGLLPQWRARVAESQALAAKLGLVPLGAQLGFEPG